VSAAFKKITCTAVDFIVSNSTDLQILDVSMNPIEGEIPDYFIDLQHLQKLDLSQTMLSGVLTSWFDGRSWDSLKYLSLAFSNVVIGPFRESDLQPFFYIEHLNISHTPYNQIFPEFLTLSQYLVSLDMSHTYSYGDLNSISWSTSNLEFVDISGNIDIGGYLPNYPPVALSKFRISGTSISGEVPPLYESVPTFEAINCPKLVSISKSLPDFLMKDTKVSILYEDKSYACNGVKQSNPNVYGSYEIDATYDGYRRCGCVDGKVY
jgi:hypothetical protein